MQDLSSATHPTQTMILEGSRNRSTGQAIFPRIPDTSPSSDQYEHINLIGPATLYSYTVIHPSPKTGLPPYTLVYADFPQGARVFGQLKCPPKQTQIGMSIDVIGNNQHESNSQSYIFVPTTENHYDS